MIARILALVLVAAVAALGGGSARGGGSPVALMRGLVSTEPAETARDYVRPADRDLFR